MRCWSPSGVRRVSLQGADLLRDIRARAARGGPAHGGGRGACPHRGEGEGRDGAYYTQVYCSGRHMSQGQQKPGSHLCRRELKIWKDRKPEGVCGAGLELVVLVSVLFSV